MCHKLKGIFVLFTIIFYLNDWSFQLESAKQGDMLMEKDKVTQCAGFMILFNDYILKYLKQCYTHSWVDQWTFLLCCQESVWYTLQSYYPLFICPFQILAENDMFTKKIVRFFFVLFIITFPAMNNFLFIFWLSIVFLYNFYIKDTIFCGSLW